MSLFVLRSILANGVSRLVNKRCVGTFWECDVDPDGRPKGRYSYLKLPCNGRRVLEGAVPERKSAWVV